MYIVLYKEHNAFIKLKQFTSDNATMWQQLISASCNIQTHRTGHTDWETGGALMAPLPNFQMNHRDSGILNLTYRLVATN